ncbi:hypothetical protein [Algoriphagus sediminis]|uniref:Uncharacterized protein n=1 Tax=Algoriphagus sediminis TaxID=3057113 RepID=A0ABT7YCH5_9BACT|nr:hypothetical protein [Algoriphagus sediminis]MDN3204230.1 hypothetical protein [Algoriphagus sediminis]
MAHWLPYHSETLVSSFSKEEVRDCLKKATSEVNYLDRRSMTREGVKFNGLIAESGFKISKIVDKGDTFLPLILGELEATPRGTIIFLKFRLFPGAKFFLGLWSVLLIIFAVVFAWVSSELSYALFCLLAGVLNYFISVFFFQRQVKVSRDIFMELLDLQVKD